MDYRYTQAQYEILQSSYDELDEQASEYRTQLIQLRQDIDKLERYEETWRHYRDFYEDILLENARLNGILLEREYGENITLPIVEARKEDFRIGDTVAFDVESEIPLHGSYFTVFDNEGLLVWEGDPLSNWVEIQDFWVPPYYGQTAYLDPMIITEDYPIGNWTWKYYFGDFIEIEGWFMVNEAIDDVIKTGPEGDIWESVERSPADVAIIAEEAVEPSIHPSYLYDEGLIPSEVARERTNYSLIWLIFTSIAVGILLILRGK